MVLEITPGIASRNDRSASTSAREKELTGKDSVVDTFAMIILLPIVG